MTNRAKNKAEIFGLVGENYHKHLKCFSKWMKITPCCIYVFLSNTGGSEKLQVDERGFQEREAFNKQN